MQKESYKYQEPKIEGMPESEFRQRLLQHIRTLDNRALEKIWQLVARLEDEKDTKV